MADVSLLVAVLKKAGNRVLTEHFFHPERRWRFDLALPDKMIALEVEGGVWAGGRHNRGSGFLKDMEKYNEATLLGWRVLRVTPRMVDTGDALVLLHRAGVDVAAYRRRK